MKSIFKSKSSYFLLFTFLILTFEQELAGQENSLNLNLKNQSTQEELQITQESISNKTEYSSILTPEKSKKKYEETSLRRLDVIFFLSLPFLLLYQFIIHQIISSNLHVNGQNDGSISKQQWIHMLFSSAIMSFCVGYSDYIAIEKVKQTNISTLNSKPMNQKLPRFKMAFNFSF